MLYGIKLSSSRLKTNFPATRTKLNPSSAQIKNLFRPSPDLSIISLTSLTSHDLLISEQKTIERQLENGTSYDPMPWKYLVSFSGEDLLNSINAQIKIINTPRLHPCHFSIVPATYDYDKVLKGEISSNMYFHLGALWQVYEFVLTQGTLHANEY